LAEVRGLGDDCILAVVLQPYGVDGSAVGRVYDDLWIKLGWGCWRNRTGQLPGDAVIIALHKDHGRKNAVRTARHGHILGIDDVDVTEGVGSYGGFPLISGVESNPLGWGETSGTGGQDWRNCLKGEKNAQAGEQQFESN
jgi:hypothetical protein